VLKPFVARSSIPIFAHWRKVQQAKCPYAKRLKRRKFHGGALAHSERPVRNFGMERARQRLNRFRALGGTIDRTAMVLNG
jgi:hypothetical protein